MKRVRHVEQDEGAKRSAHTRPEPGGPANVPMPPTPVAYPHLTPQAATPRRCPLRADVQTSFADDYGLRRWRDRPAKCPQPSRPLGHPKRSAHARATDALSVRRRRRKREASWASLIYSSLACILLLVASPLLFCVQNAAATLPGAAACRLLSQELQLGQSGGPRNRTWRCGFGDHRVTDTPVPQKCRFAGDSWAATARLGRKVKGKVKELSGEMSRQRTVSTAFRDPRYLPNPHPR